MQRVCHLLQTAITFSSFKNVMPTFNSSKHLIEWFQRYLPTEENVGIISNMYPKDHKVKQLLGNIITPDSLRIVPSVPVYLATCPSQ